MANIIHVIENLTNGYRTITLDVISVISIFLPIGVIIVKNPVVSVLLLIGLFVAIACYLLLLGLDFIGLSYLLVYVGAVSILFLFILMLINVRASELATDTTNSIPLVIAIGILASLIANYITPVIESTVYMLYDYGLSNLMIKQLYINIVFFVSSSIWDGALAEAIHIMSIGNIMYSSYSIWLIITSIILLLAMVGCIVITIKKGKQV